MANILWIYDLNLEQIALEQLELDLNVLYLEVLNMVGMNIMRTPRQHTVMP